VRKQMSAPAAKKIVSKVVPTDRFLEFTFSARTLFSECFELGAAACEFH